MSGNLNLVPLSKTHIHAQKEFLGRRNSLNECSRGQVQEEQCR